MKIAQQIVKGEQFGVNTIWEKFKSTQKQIEKSHSQADSLPYLLSVPFHFTLHGHCYLTGNTCSC